MSAKTLTIQLQSYWHAGGGRGGGSVVDAVVHRDLTGLPDLPGRHIKGLLRDALERADAYGWSGFKGLAQHLFGDRPEEAGRRAKEPQPGCLRVTDARLPDDLVVWLGRDDKSGGKHLVPHLFRNLHATAVEHDTGTAKDKSLRATEVVVPLTLYSRVEPIPSREPPPVGWADRLSGVLPLIEAVGAHRRRGLGRAILSLEEVA